MGIVAVVAVGLRFAAAQDRLPYPDTQKLIIENTFVRVFDIRVPPGVAEAKHSHARGVTVALTAYDNETRVEGASSGEEPHQRRRREMGGAGDT